MHVVSIVNQAGTWYYPKGRILKPGFEQIRFTIERDGMIAAFEKMGLKYMNACGPCIDNGIEQVQINKKKIIVHLFNVIF
jgi:aconitate hydratase